MRAHPVLASDDTVAESNESYSAGAAAAAPAVSTVLLHSSLEGLCGGIQLDQSLPIGDLRRALEIIGDGASLHSHTNTQAPKVGLNLCFLFRCLLFFCFLAGPLDSFLGFVLCRALFIIHFVDLVCLWCACRICRRPRARICGRSADPCAHSPLRTRPARPQGTSIIILCTRRLCVCFSCTSGHCRRYRRHRRLAHSRLCTSAATAASFIHRRPSRRC